MGAFYRLGTLGAKKGVLIQGYAGGRPNAMKDMFVNLKKAGHGTFGARDINSDMGLWNRYSLSVYLLCTIRESKCKMSLARIIS